MSPDWFLYITLTLYTLGTASALLAVIRRSPLLQKPALALMTAGLITHTIWIGSICVRTGHAPITNLPETASFIAWTILVIKLLLHFRYRIQGANFFIYPLVLILLVLSALIGESIEPLEPALRSRVFIGHLLLTNLGVAALLIAGGFTILYLIQEKAVREKRQSALSAWLPSLRACDQISYRALAVGFSIYTAGIFTGFIWSYMTPESNTGPGAKEIGAFVAWLMFAALLQSHLSGNYRTRKNLLIAAVAFASIMVSILGIQHA